jgi:adenylate cyclase
MRMPPRRLTVLASTDVVGYTRLLEADERGTLAEVEAIRLEVMQPTLSTYNGNLFKEMGDGALIEFTNVEDSVRWALEFQTAMRERNGTQERPILFRCGIALADVYVQGEDRFGRAVAFVVRIQEVAPPGGIVVTHSIRWQLAKDLAAMFARTESVLLKGNDEPIEVSVWTLPDEANKPVGEPTLRELPRVPAPSLASDMPSIAVLAFDNMSGDPSAETIADGIVEEITSSLSRIRDFTVIARNSAYAYKGRARDLRGVSRELGVRYLLEGSLRKAGERVRITAQLIDAATGTHIWADSYNGVLSNLFDFEDEIAERVAGALRPSIRAAEIALAKRKRPENLAAYDLVLKALPHLWAHRRDDNSEAIRLLDQARKLDPSYARATAVAAWARAQHVVYNWTTEIDAHRAEGGRLIEHAADTIGDDPTGLTALATAVTLLVGDLDRASYFIDRALKLDPNHAWAWTRRGFISVYRGDAEEATASFERSLRLSPLDPFSFNSYIGLGLSNFALGKPDEAAQWTRRAMSEKVGMTWAYRDLATFLAAAGKIEEAKAALVKLMETRPYLNLTDVAKALSFMEPSLLRRYVEGLRVAGLPE